MRLLLHKPGQFYAFDDVPDNEKAKKKLLEEGYTALGILKDFPTAGPVEDMGKMRRIMRSSDFIKIWPKKVIAYKGTDYFVVLTEELDKLEEEGYVYDSDAKDDAELGPLEKSGDIFNAKYRVA